MAQNSNYSYLPTTEVYDYGYIQNLDINSPEFKQFLVKLYQNTNRITTMLNTKDTGYYITDELINGQQWFPDPALTSTSPQRQVFRNIYRKVIVFGALPVAGTKSVPHNIPVDATYTFTRIYGVANDHTGETYLPLPFVSSIDIAHMIELNIDHTNVNIITGINRSNYTDTNIILEYFHA